MRLIGMSGLQASLSSLAAFEPFGYLSGARTRQKGMAVEPKAEAAANPLLAVSSVLLSKTELPAGEAGLSLAKVHATLQELLPAGTVDIYEAGGGSTCYLPTTLLSRARLTVVDIDPVQIANNEYAETRICGDVQTHWLAPGSVDLVTCYNVIEHLPDVEAAIMRFSEALRPGGLLLIGAPYPISLSGLVTRCSPHWFHIWYYRHIRGERRAGEPGQAPFPVHYHPLVHPQRLKRYAEMRQRHPALAWATDTATGLMNLMLGARTNVRHGDYHLVLRKSARPID